jgi:diketogulonate reductase-like aldo/keto reductase
MAEDARRRDDEISALRLGLDLGLTLVDTAEMYSEGDAEELVGEAIRGHRDEVFLVSKVLPSHAGRDATIRACDPKGVEQARNVGGEVLHSMPVAGLSECP